ncbi:AMP-binding protein [Marinobacter salarius]|uniref:AMP-binding protein n=1 Tax=Marinobacter salarius TaxID=1420917 RepID=UPI00273C4BED|nr:AMP-binding protein [Marinobacter salarius]MDP4534099.1 AMP-binding protein [Marinobacter salarius]
MVSDQLTLKPLYTGAMKKYRGRVAVHFDGKTLSYGELLRQSSRAAHALIGAGIIPNTRVALMMSNCAEYVIADQAIIQSGAAKVPLNDMLGENEIHYILKHSNSQLAIVGPNFFDVVARNRSKWSELKTIVGIAPESECPDGFLPWEEFLAQGEESIPEVDVAPDDLATIVYTGGTTGMPKGVVHTQQSVSLNMFSHAMEMELLDDEKILLCSPLPHGAGYVLQAGLLKGATHFIEQRFDPNQIVQRIEQDGVTMTFMVPTMIYRLIDWIGDKKYDLGTLRTIFYGAAPITEERLRQGLEILGPVFMQLYGQTEAPMWITRLRREDHRLDETTAHRLKSCGQPVAMAQVRIVDELGHEVPRGEGGEVAVRTPYNMARYHELPEKTAETLTDGWLRTGDIARQDEDGYIYLLDRNKDMIISGGMNVYTLEVENAVQSCPGVNQVAVVGLPDPDWGEAVTAFVVLETEAELTEEDIIRHCRRELSAYKRPKRVYFRDVLPLTVYSKLDKKALRESAKS